MSEDRRRKREPLGQPLDWTDDEIADLARVESSDLVDARAWAHERLPTRFRTMLDAEPAAEPRDDVAKEDAS